MELFSGIEESQIQDGEKSPSWDSVFRVSAGTNDYVTLFCYHSLDVVWPITQMDPISFQKLSVQNKDQLNTYILQLYLGGCFKYFLFSPLPGEMIQFD